MYASIYGTVQEINANLIYLEHNNYGYEINLVINKLFEFKKTMQIKLYTFLVVKDYFQWFGFLDLATKKILGVLHINGYYLIYLKTRKFFSFADCNSN